MTTDSEQIPNRTIDRENVGYEQEGELTGGLRRQPSGVILMDEFDKAHLEVQNLFLQVFDEGRLTDAEGRTADAGNVLFILTSNLSPQLQGEPGFQVRRRDEARRAVAQQGLKPELVNRIDEVVVFRALEKADVAGIAEGLLEQLAERLKSRGIGLEWNESVLEALEKEGYSNEFGVREHRVENWIAGMVLPEEVGEGEKVVLRVEQGQWQAGVQGGRQEEE